MRRFVMVRDSDVNDVSGTGLIIWGCEWPDGRVAYRWNTATRTSTCADSIEDVVAIHGHDGATRLIWLDSATAGKLWRLIEAQEQPVLLGTEWV